MIKKIFLKLKEKLCRHDYKPSSYYVIDNHIVCIAICSKCERRQTKEMEYNLDSKLYVESLGYKKDYGLGIWAGVIRGRLKTLETIKQIKADPEAKTIKILEVNRPSIKNFSVKDSDING